MSVKICILKLKLLLFFVKILVFVVYENPLLLREAHTLGRTMLIMFLDRRNIENS